MKKSTVKHINFYSKILNKTMGINVYLPKEYDNMHPLPVLYFLHGRSGDETILTELKIDEIADKLIEQNKISPLIIVCPRIENSRGINSSPTCKEILSPGDSGIMINVGRYEDYFIKEVIPFIDQTFYTIPTKNGRYLGGISAGGYAALHNSFRHQELFSKVGVHMPAIELTLEPEDTPYFQDRAMWEKYDPITIAKNNMISKDLKVYLDAGNHDEGRFYEGCKFLHKILKEKGIESQNHVYEGHHNIEYIQSNLEKYLIFYTNH